MASLLVGCFMFAMLVFISVPILGIISAVKGYKIESRKEKLQELRYQTELKYKQDVLEKMKMIIK